MYFQSFYLECLAQASYMIGSDGIAAVVDPQRDVDLYLDEAARNGMRIGYVIETHLHADFVSGHRELAARSGAQIYLGAKAQAGFLHVAVHDGDTLSFGDCRLEFIETPGHTPESMCVAVTDTRRALVPYAVFTGDTLFVGDVGRPDLSDADSTSALAGKLYDSLHTKLLTLPDEVEVFPAHGAGSLCGRSMSAERSSTIGRERKTNDMLRAPNRAAFIDWLTTDLPERPAYFARAVQLNRAGPRSLIDLGPLAALGLQDVLARQRRDALVLDTRTEERFGQAHLAGSMHIGLGGQYASWAARLIGLDTDIVLVSEDTPQADESRVRLARVGIERVTGYLDGGIAGLRRRADAPLDRVPQLAVAEVRELLDDPRKPPRLIDVRRPSEWEAGHISGAAHMPLDTLSGALDGIGRTNPVVVYCKGGYRSSIATSVLRRAGFKEVANMIGGFDAWLDARFPYSSPTHSQPAL